MRYLYITLTPIQHLDPLVLNDVSENKFACGRKRNCLATHAEDKNLIFPESNLQVTNPRLGYVFLSLLLKVLVSCNDWTLSFRG